MPEYFLTLTITTNKLRNIKNLFCTASSLSTWVWPKPKRNSNKACVLFREVELFWWGLSVLRWVCSGYFIDKLFYYADVSWGRRNLYLNPHWFLQIFTFLFLIHFWKLFFYQSFGSSQCRLRFKETSLICSFFNIARYSSLSCCLQQCYIVMSCQC